MSIPAPLEGAGYSEVWSEAAWPVGSSQSGGTIGIASHAPSAAMVSKIQSESIREWTATDPKGQGLSSNSPVIEQAHQASKVLLPSQPQQWTSSTVGAFLVSTFNVFPQTVPTSSCPTISTAVHSASSGDFRKLQQTLQSLTERVDQLQLEVSRQRYANRHTNSPDGQRRSLTPEDSRGRTPERCRYDRPSYTDYDSFSKQRRPSYRDTSGDKDYYEARRQDDYRDQSPRMSQERGQRITARDSLDRSNRGRGDRSSDGYSPKRLSHRSPSDDSLSFISVDHQNHKLVDVTVLTTTVVPALSEAIISAKLASHQAGLQPNGYTGVFEPHYRDDSKGGVLCRTAYSGPGKPPNYQVVIPDVLIKDTLYDLHGDPCAGHYSAERAAVDTPQTYGSALVSRMETVFQEVFNTSDDQRLKREYYFNRYEKFRPYKVGDLVWMNDPTTQRKNLEPKWIGPYRMVTVDMAGIIYTVSDMRNVNAAPGPGGSNQPSLPHVPVKR
ncbi:unnamed protein product [Leuciscus chuanchicus]